MRHVRRLLQKIKISEVQALSSPVSFQMRQAGQKRSKGEARDDRASAGVLFSVRRARRVERNEAMGVLDGLLCLPALDRYIDPISLGIVNAVLRVRYAVRPLRAAPDTGAFG